MALKIRKIVLLYNMTGYYTWMFSECGKTYSTFRDMFMRNSIKNAFKSRREAIAAIKKIFPQCEKWEIKDSFIVEIIQCY